MRKYQRGKHRGVDSQQDDHDPPEVRRLAARPYRQKDAVGDFGGEGVQRRIGLPQLNQDGADGRDAADKGQRHLRYRQRHGGLPGNAALTTDSRLICYIKRS